ncbi:MAG: FAD-dependent oxidoreductase, partial [Desulfobacterales bacterium]|nr:FAD-dependent oxidoreductase [Desulfobacterales bacterium]
MNQESTNGLVRGGAPTSSDVLIIGGGVIGMACAHYLAQAGRAVHLIEQGRIGAGASHGNCGLVVASYLLPMCAPGVVQKEIVGLLRTSSPLYVKPTLEWRSWAARMRCFRSCSGMADRKGSMNGGGFSSFVGPKRRCKPMKPRTIICVRSVTPPSPSSEARCTQLSRRCARMSS